MRIMYDEEDRIRACIFNKSKIFHTNHSDPVAGEVSKFSRLVVSDSFGFRLFIFGSSLPV